MGGDRIVRWVVAGAVALGALGAVQSAHPRRTAAAVAVVATFDPTPRPLGPITVFGDSVLKGSVELQPSLVHRLAEAGWGPIQARAGGSYSTGEWLSAGPTRASYWIDVWRDQGWDAAPVVIHLGANDAGICRGDVTCARRNIEFVLDRLGAGHRVWWPMITHRTPSYAAGWNTALAQVAAERDDFFTWDWPTVFATGNFPTSDGIHLDATGYRIRASLMADEITADLARGHTSGTAAALPAAGPPSEFVPIESTRMLDTRESGTPVAAGEHVEVDVSAVVPPGATAVAAYVSATNTAGPGHLTAYACRSERPAASATNYAAGHTRGAVALTPLGTDATLCLYTHATADLLVDVQGAFVPVAAEHPDALRLFALDTPARLIDTRLTEGRANPIVLTLPWLPVTSAAVAVNLTAVGGRDPGHLVAYPCDAEPPHSAAVNHRAGEAVAGSAFVPLAGDGTFCVWSKAASAHIVADLTGVFVEQIDAPPPGSLPGEYHDQDLVFVPVAPTRTIDTRDGTGGWGPVHGQGQVVAAAVAPGEARAVSGTLTIAGPARAGYLRAWGCTGVPTTSNVNSPAGATFANLVTTGVGGGRLCVSAHSLTSTIFDTTGWWLP